jgi:hypothetical protein
MIQRQGNAPRMPRILVGLCFILSMLAAGCGSLESTVLHRATDVPAPEVDAAQMEAVMPTDAPTSTPVPPTDTPIPEPTATATPPPTATPAPTETPVLSPIDRMVAVRNPEKGKVLFETFQENAGSGYSCSNCHLPTSEKTNIGPGLLNIKHRAAMRIEGLTAAEYIYESIINSMAYTVEGFEVDLMPQNWAEIYTDLEIFDIVAYLLTLEGESDIDDPDPEDTESVSDSD